MHALFRRFRLLSITAVVAFLVMMVKLNAVWDGLAALDASGVVATASAASGGHGEKGGHAEKGKDAHAGGTKTAAKDAPKDTPKDAPKDTPKDAPKDTAQAPPSPAEGDQGPHLTPSEIEVLQQLAQRREELARRADALDRREGLLKAAEHRLDQKLQGLKDLQATLERLIAEYKAQQDEQTQTLVKIYENMKPKDAARIFEELEMGTLLGVADRMKERKLAALLAEMNPARAKEVTEELARLRTLPKASGAADAGKRS